MSEEQIDTSDWGWWDWYDCRQAVVEGKGGTHNHMGKRGLIKPEYEPYEEKSTYTVNGEEKTMTTRGHRLVALNPDPRLEAVWLAHINSIENCGPGCQNHTLSKTSDGRCGTCGGTFQDGAVILRCLDCGKEGEPLSGHIMGARSYCRKCNEKHRQKSGGPCLMCNKKYWDCCC